MKRTFSRFDIELLVAYVVCIAGTDKTGQRIDQQLQDLDTFVVGQGNGPAAYADIARKALAQYEAGGGNSPEIIALLQLAVFRGERLLPVSAAREEELKQIKHDLGKVIAALPQGPMQVRCQILFQHHISVFYALYGYFRLAVEAQKLAAEQADRSGKLPEAAICRHLAAFYDLCQALRADQTGWSEQRIADAFTSLEQKFAQMVEVTRGTDKQMQWGQGNGPWHMLLACIWLGRYYHANWNFWVETFLIASKELGSSFEPAAQLVRAAHLDKFCVQQAEAALQAVAGDAIQSNGNRATALLILARRAAIASDWLKAAELISKMPEIGAQHVRAVAARLLA